MISTLIAARRKPASLPIRLSALPGGLAPNFWPRIKVTHTSIPQIKAGIIRVEKEVTIVLVSLVAIAKEGKTNGNTKI